MTTSMQNLAETTKGGKLRWREHELIMVTAIAAISLVGWLWYVFHNSPNEFEAPFLGTHTPFNLYRNVLFPGISMGLSGYLVYLWFNLYAIPRLLHRKKEQAGISKASSSTTGERKKNKWQSYGWFFIQFIFIAFVLGVVANVSTYYRHQWQFNYPGFSIFFDEDNPKSQLAVSATFFAAASVMALYGLYLAVREVGIQIILSSRQREYNISVCNKATLFVLVLVTSHVLLQALNLEHEQQFWVSYIFVVSGVFAMFISNVYWLFPMKGSGSFFSGRIIRRLLSTSFVYAIPLINFVHENGPVAFLYSWALQLFIVTPLTWLYYQTNKEKILQLRVVEKELVKSKADLQFLRSQINPHFLFNVLNTLYGTALQESADRTAEGIQQLGDMMRFMLHENNLDFIPMHKEMAYLENYITLQKLRTQSSPQIVIENNISKQTCNHTITPMLLIPLVENAFKHGISLQEKSWISINLECTDKQISFQVSNSIHAKAANDPEKESNGIGFSNVQERLKLLYPGKHELTVNRDEKTFSVKLLIVVV